MYILPKVILEISKNLEMYLIYSNELIASYFSCTLNLTLLSENVRKPPLSEGLKK